MGRIFGPNGLAASLTGLRGTRGRRRGAAQGLFMQPGEKEQVEFGYCFDVSISSAIYIPFFFYIQQLSDTNAY